MRIFAVIAVAGFGLFVSQGPASAEGLNYIMKAGSLVDHHGCIYRKDEDGSWVRQSRSALCHTSPERIVATATDGRVRVGPRSAPRKIAEAREIHPVHGYAAAFDDGRLNPYSGVGTRAGKADMARVWTNTVPRRLVDRATGPLITE